MDKIQKSLARIEGQVRGIRKMYAGKKKCLETVQQVVAARQALGRVGRELLKHEACQCMVKESQKNKLDKILKQLFKN
ncbi:MAG: metal-sensitive transcriptional regulator [Candidatus Beckwithbacteria bacterium]|nr:metal-sensitive transcriptional regulator [Candidatus Beckwithbacteria bacterium]